MGPTLILFGIIIIIQPRWYGRGGTLHDLTGYNIPFGIFMIVLGILCIRADWKARKKK